MPEVNVPDFSLQWAAGGDILKPSDSKINTGWAAEIPPRQWFNWLDNRQDQAIAHIIQHGIAQWSSVIEYQANKSYVQGSDGFIYVAKTTNTNQNPTNDSAETNWISLGKKLSGVNYAIGSSATVNAYTANFTPTLKALTDGQIVYVRAPSANTNTTPSFSPDGLIAKTLVKGANLPLAIGDIAAGGQILQLQYSSQFDKWILLNPAIPESTLTSANNNQYDDVSSKPVSSDWLRNGMVTLAKTAGFSFSGGPVGYWQCPNWLGGFIVQWGTVMTGVVSVSSVTYPKAFPNAFYGIIQSTYNDGAGSTDAARSTTSATPLSSMTFRLTNADGGTSINWWAFGR